MKRSTKGGGRKPRKEAPPRPYDVVALVASAGGNAAIARILSALPEGFALPIVVMQHFPQGWPSEPLRGCSTSLPLVIEWASDGAVLAPGQVLVTPPRSFLDVLPDGTCMLAPCERGPLDKPIDRLFRSLARSFAHRAIGVVLSGMMDDGADGARDMRAAGGSVIAQSEADYGAMPQAAMRSGGADVSLRVEAIASLLIELEAGGVIPRPVPELEAVDALFAGDGQARAAMRAVNWSATPLGPVREWSSALTTAVRNQMSSSFPTCIYWGPEHVQIYNDAYLPLLGAKPSPAGKPARLTWPELWSSLGPRLEAVLRTGQAVLAEDQLFQLERHGYPEEAYVTYSESPLFDSDGRVHGVLVTATETTERVRASRRLEMLGQLAAFKRGQSTAIVAESAAKTLAGAPLDVPFALLYLLDTGRRRATLAATVGVEAGTPGAPRAVVLSDERSVWPLADVVRGASVTTVNDLDTRLRGLHFGPWPESPSSAFLVPLTSGADGPLAGVAVFGASPRLRFDPTYDDFLRVVAQHISTAIGEAEARRHEGERSQRLGELDRAKVDFFSNVSHEFRTPLTLLLGPLEEMLGRRSSLPADLEKAVETAARNGRRLVQLVNDLLDFSQAESHRARARLEPTDLAALTTDIASAFRSAIQSGGLRFEVRCEAGMAPVEIDRQMWEKIVSNLLSNALKFTFEGKIRVTLRALSLHAELVVQDTGVGIPERELPNLFKRFHRVQGARARTAEGSGIGLWMVDDLVKRLGGQLRVRSKENAGTTFTIWVPFRSVRAGASGEEPTPALHPPEFASHLAREVSRWAADAETDGGAAHAPSGALDDLFGSPHGPGSPAGRLPEVRILVVDDNADMREYLERLLSPRWRVDTAADGERAFEAAVDTRPDLILADVMMPGLDGFELLKRVRAHPELGRTPVVLVTARAGEEAAIEGLVAGADDYIGKPFSPRELVARIAAVVDRSRADAALRASEEKYRTLFDSMDEGFCIIEVLFDADGRTADCRLVEVNRVFLTQTGVGGALGKTMRELVPELEDFWFDTYGDIARTGQARRFEHQAHALNRWFDVYAFRIGAPEERKVAILFKDIKERKDAELAVREHGSWLRGQREALELAVNSAPLERSLGPLVGTARESLGPGTRAAFYLASSDGSTLHHVVGMPAEYAAATDGFRMGPETLACRLATHTGKPVLTPDVQTDPLWEPWRWLAERFDYRGYWSFPIYSAAGTFVGTLAIYSGQPRAATDRDLELASLLTHTAAVIISRHRETEVRKQAEEGRARAEQALRDSEKRFRAFVTASSDVIYRMSPDWSEMRALDGQGFLSDTAEPTEAWMSRYIHPDDQAHVWAAIQRAIRDKAVFELEHRVRQADGSLGWTHSRAIPVLDEQGEIIEWMGAARNLPPPREAQEPPREKAERPRSVS